MIISIILYVIFISLAAIFKAASDICADHFDDSIFTKYDRQFWDKSVSWKNKWIGGDKANGHKKGLRYWDPVSDAWHISNGLLIASFIIAAIFLWFSDIPQIQLTAFAIFAGTGLLFVGVFNTFYNHIFKKKK